MDNDDESSFSTDATTTAAIVVSRRGPSNSSKTCCYTIGVAAIVPRKRNGLDDPIQQTLTYYSFLDDKHSFSNLDSILTRLSPLSVVHIACTESAASSSKSTNNLGVIQRQKEVKTVLDRLASLVDTHPVPSDLTNLSNVIDSLPKHPPDYLSSTLSSILTESSNLSYRNNPPSSIACTALSLLLHCTPALSPPLLLSPSSLSSHLSLSRTSMDAINLLPPRQNPTANSSLYQILNATKTKMGSQMLHMWCRQPLVSIDDIRQRHDAVETFFSDGSGRDQLRDALMGIVDLDAVGGRLVRGQKLEDLYKIYIFAERSLPDVILALDNISENFPETNTNSNPKNTMIMESLHNLQKCHKNLENLKGLVTTVLDMDLAPREFLVRRDFDEELSDLKREMENIDAELQDIHNQMNEEWSSVSSAAMGAVRLETDTDGHWQFRLINANSEKTLRGLPHVRVHKILKNGVYFSTKELRELGVSKGETMKQYQQKQKGIVANAIQVAETYLPVLEKASQIIATLDVLQGFAHTAAYNPNGYIRPNMTDSDEDGMGIILKDARHPCVELQDNVSFIANDFNLTLGSSSFLLVTGPNMGGKSTYIRSLASIVTMAQMGSFVPCNEATINICHSILARVGAGDAQQKGISTFMAEMLEASSILAQADRRSLVIIDELGRGTSTFDGFGLARAISEYLVEEKKCMTVFATHFHELTTLESTYPCVKNCHVSACCGGTTDERELTFLYEVKEGPCLESFGIKVAEMAKVPESVIKEAKRKASELECFQDGQMKKSKVFLDGFAKLDFDANCDDAMRLATELVAS